MSDIKNIHLQFSCPENRTSLNKIDKGYFCEQCQHLVKDFTCSSKKSLMKAISNTTKPICGMFKRSQLNEKFLKLGVITIAASSIATASHGQSQMIYDSLDQADQYAIGHEYADEVFGIIIDTPAIPVGGYKRFYEAIS
ncbi:MAG: hypothetical protein AAF843_17585 [Bacteroidota bacterium]